jgi:predicted PurR-regulated permease PerM
VLKNAVSGHNQPVPRQGERVPVRTILATIGLVLATALVLLLIVQVRRVLMWIVIALFFAVALYPVVGWVERHVPPRRRAVATLLVFLGGAIVLAGLVALFVTPLVREASQVAGRLPSLIEDARNGRGPVGELLARFHVLDYIQRNQERISQVVGGLGTPALHYLRAAATGVVAVVTVFVLAYLMVLQGPKAVEGMLALLPESRAERVRNVGADCAKTVTGYLSGNVLISVICGLLTWLVLLVLGVPFAALIALFVAIADLVPLIGATLGAVVAVLVGFVHSTTAGIVLIVFFVLYQQLENHLLQPVILSRTVRLNPLTVLVSILIAVELAGILGALLAIPVAGVIQVVVRDMWNTRQGRPKAEPTVGEDKMPVSGAGGRTSPLPGTAAIEPR